MYVPNLQEAIDRYALSLDVPMRLARLHPRKKGNPGNAGALAPAVVLTSISAFEGFVEEFLAIAAAHLGMSFGQIAQLIQMNNPRVKTFEDKLTNLLNWAGTSTWKTAFLINVWKPPAIGGTTWITKTSLNWNQTLDAAEGWMQVRHCLTHGLVRGYRPELWPGPMKGTIPASSVLRPNPHGKYSLSIHGAESCIHIHRAAAEALATQAATSLNVNSLDWSSVPDFAL